MDQYNNNHCGTDGICKRKNLLMHLEERGKKLMGAYENKNKTGFVYHIDSFYKGRRYVMSTKTSDLKIAQQYCVIYRKDCPWNINLFGI